MILAAVALLFAGWGFYSTTRDDSSGLGSSTATPTQAAGSAAQPSATTTSAAVIIPVHALNNSNVKDLAQRVAAQVEAQGWTIGEVGNYPYEVLPASTVFYTEGNAVEQRAAEALAEQLGITAGPRPERLKDYSNGIILVITKDLE